MNTILAKQHRLSLELAIRALHEQAQQVSRYHSDFPDAEGVSRLIREAAVKLRMASDRLLGYCPDSLLSDSLLYAPTTLTDRIRRVVVSLFRRGE